MLKIKETGGGIAMKKVIKIFVLFLFLIYVTSIFGGNSTISFKNTCAGTSNDNEILLHNIEYNDPVSGTIKLWAKFQFDMNTLSLKVVDAGYESSTTTSSNTIEEVGLDTLGDFSHGVFDFSSENYVSFNDSSADISVEPWCVDYVALCGDYVNIGNKSLSNVTSSDIPSSGFPDEKISNFNFSSYCEKVLLNNTYINKNSDGSYTAFMITSHEKSGECNHQILVKYVNLK